MRNMVFLLILVSSAITKAQDNTEPDENSAIPQVVDSLYREDQFYISLSFNLINNEPNEFSQNGFSGGLHVGFIRDMPINKRRNFAIGVGLGLSTNSYNTNLFIGEDAAGNSIFDILDGDTNVDTNRLNLNIVEVPIQFRWRTSTATRFDFWRIYTGMKIGYVFYYRSKFEGEGTTIRQTDIPELNNTRFTATFTAGNGSFNAFIHYDLNALFNDDARIDNEPINLQPLRFGIEFYLL